MGSQILITGGAGFIGSHLADALLARGHRVRALDALAPQVHGVDGCRPDYLDPRVELLVGDVRDAAVVRRALAGADVVFHLAAAVGVGQSMYGRAARGAERAPARTPDRRVQHERVRRGGLSAGGRPALPRRGASARAAQGGPLGGPGARW